MKSVNARVDLNFFSIAGRF